MKKQNKKGFTLTELVIVIVIIAVLAAVLIPAYSGYVQKAKKANDTVLIKELNDALQANEQSSDYKFRNVSEVLDSLEKILGTKQSSIKAQASGNTFVWNQDTNRFYILTKDDDNNAKYTTTNDSVAPLPTGDANKTYKYWIIYSIDNDFVTVTSTTVTSDYSVYLASNLYTNTLTTSTGLDLGKNTIYNINYNHEDSTNPQTVLIVTNSEKETVNINAKYDTVEHYGMAGVVDITAVDTNCYEEYGTTNIAQIASGKIKIEQGGLIKTVLLTATTASVQNVGGADSIGNVYATSQDVINANNSDTANVQISSENVKETTLENLEKQEVPFTYYSSKTDTEAKVTVKNDGTCQITSVSEDNATVEIPEGVTKITTETLSKDLKVEALILPSGVTTIEFTALAGSEIKYVYIPNTVTEWGGNDFVNSAYLEQVTLEEGITSIGSRAFAGCTSLTSITIPSSVTAIAANAFNGCTSLSSVVFEEGVSCAIAESVFTGCSALKEITIPSTITSIGATTFSGLENLTKAYIGVKEGYVWGKLVRTDTKTDYTQRDAHGVPIQVQTPIYSKMDISTPEKAASALKEGYHKSQLLPEEING